MKISWMIFIAICGIVLTAILVVFILPRQIESNNTVMLGATGKMGPFGLIYSNGLGRGIYEKYGLNVTYTQVNSAYTGMIALLTGKLDAISTSPGIVASAYFEGENIFIGMAMGEASNLILIVKPGYSDLTNLKGKRFGVIGTNSDSYRIIKSYLDLKGLDLETEVDLVEISKPANLLSTFQTGQLEAAVLMSGYAVEAINSGGISIITITDAAEELFGYPTYSTVSVLGEHFIEREKVAKKFLKAQREIAREIEKDPDGAIAIHAAFAEETPEKMRAVFEIVDLVCDLDPDVKEGIIAYSEFCKSQGFFDDVIGDDIFFDSWK